MMTCVPSQKGGGRGAPSKISSFCLRCNLSTRQATASPSARLERTRFAGCLVDERQSATKVTMRRSIRSSTALRLGLRFALAIGLREQDGASLRNFCRTMGCAEGCLALNVLLCVKPDREMLSERKPEPFPPTDKHEENLRACKIVPYVCASQAGAERC